MALVLEASRATKGRALRKQQTLAEPVWPYTLGDYDIPELAYYDIATVAS